MSHEAKTPGLVANEKDDRIKDTLMQSAASEERYELLLYINTYSTLFLFDYFQVKCDTNLSRLVTFSDILCTFLKKKNHSHNTLEKSGEDKDGEKDQQQLSLEESRKRHPGGCCFAPGCVLQSWMLILSARKVVCLISTFVSDLCAEHAAVSVTSAQLLLTLPSS